MPPEGAHWVGWEALAGHVLGRKSTKGCSHVKLIYLREAVDTCATPTAAMASVRDGPLGEKLQKVG